MVPTNYYVILSAILFGLGVVAFVFKRNIITIFMAIELMLNAVNLAFVAFARMHNNLGGQVIAFFVMVVAAAEVVVGIRARHGILLQVCAYTRLRASKQRGRRFTMRR